MKVLMTMLGLLGTMYAAAQVFMLAARVSAVGTNMNSRSVGASLASITLGIVLAFICFRDARRRSHA